MDNLTRNVVREISSTLNFLYFLDVPFVSDSLLINENEHCQWKVNKKGLVIFLVLFNYKNNLNIICLLVISD